ncbi:MAG: sodium:solute symporter family protein [Rickettsiales bacterium]|nr:sodium:solute symporter family protein [Rickettsiales bacterium]
MNYYTFLFLTSLILLLSLYIGQRAAKLVKNEDDYFLGGRKLSFFRVCMGILATQLGGGAIIGAAQAAYQYGWFAISYSLGIAIGLILLSMGIGSKLRRMNISTIPQIFNDIYESRFLCRVSSVIYITSMFFILVAIGSASRKFALSIGFNQEWIFISFWLVVIFYTSSGGLNAVTDTDILQIIFVLVAFVLTYLFLPHSLPIISDLNNNVQIDYNNVPWVSWVLVPCLFTIIGQDMAQRCFAAKSPSMIKWAMIVAAILLLCGSVLPVYLGMVSKILNVEAVSNQSVLINAIIMLTNEHVVSIFCCAILMAILSTADSLLCAISSNVVLDFFNKSDQASFKKLKYVTFLIGIIAMAGSYIFDNVIDTMIFAYNISICSLFVPIIMSIFLKKPKVKAAYVAIFVGGFSFILMTVLYPSIYKEMISLVASFVLFLAVQLYSEKR